MLHEFIWKITWKIKNSKPDIDFNRNWNFPSMFLKLVIENGAFNAIMMIKNSNAMGLAYIDNI